MAQIEDAGLILSELRSLTVGPFELAALPRISNHYSNLVSFSVIGSNDVQVLLSLVPSLVSSGELLFDLKMQAMFASLPYLERLSITGEYRTKDYGPAIPLKEESGDDVRGRTLSTMAEVISPVFLVYLSSDRFGIWLAFKTVL